MNKLISIFNNIFNNLSPFILQDNKKGAHLLFQFFFERRLGSDTEIASSSSFLKRTIRRINVMLTKS
ncbi:hypothetical protein BpHYR1_040009 [Brachionus plicatilis]|uniref:Uncharacterized protein n=1 Tax=Brachionus plicatilis TaxID=10195 RepID=A0A3M7P715_BRAPC|nr:hypothetical protein BpHYR1_040009 [Brachionus plicatilis]